MPSQSASSTVTPPARPNIRMSASPITNGGVMIGSMASTRKRPVKRRPARVAASAKASPSAVDPSPTRTARINVFQATPQRRLEAKQSSPQTERSKNFSASWFGANTPASSWTALARIVATGRNTKMAVSATTTPIAPTMNASPRHQPRPASPWQSSISKAVATRPAPGPMPAWLGPSPKRWVSKGKVQPLSPMANPCRMRNASPVSPAMTSTRLASARCCRRIRGQVASRRASAIGASHQARPASTSLSAAREPSAE